MAVKKVKHHFKLAGFIFILSGFVLLISAMWSLSYIELPSKVVHFSRYAATELSSVPRSGAYKLEVKFHKQEHSLSCEAATLKMVFDYYGMDVSESEIVDRMLFDSTTRSEEVWGDPDLGFVGDIDGKMGIDGYGIHAGALAVTASQWKGTKIIKNGSASDLVGHISEGRPVIIWGYLGRGKPMNWVTPEGKAVNAINGEHTFVVYGFNGPADNPKGFLLMDPIYGEVYWETEKLLQKWSVLGYSGIVVYP